MFINVFDILFIFIVLSIKPHIICFCVCDRSKIIMCHSNSTKVPDASRRYIDCSLLVACCIIAGTQEPHVVTLIRR